MEQYEVEDFIFRMNSYKQEERMARVAWELRGIGGPGGMAPWVGTLI